MKSFLRLFLVPLVALTFAGTSFAQMKSDAPAQPEKKMEKKAETTKATRTAGNVVSVDAKAGMLTVKTKDKELSFTAESKTAKSALEKLKAGDRVSVSYTEKNGKLMARSVTPSKGPTAAKTMDKPAEKKTETK